MVVHGREIGHVLGFPTANISTKNELFPPDGVYAVMVAMEGRLLQGACSIGNNPTFEGGGRTIEVFLLDFSGRLYGRELAICFVERLRGLAKFPDAGALITAIQQDVATTGTVLASVDQGLIKPLLSQDTERSMT
jgi:riboflavin kinase/FMN adenylyltransferase